MQLARALTKCEALTFRGVVEVVSAAEIADATSSAVAAITSAEVCEKYCEAIWKACEMRAENRATCGAAVITAVLAMMEAHPASMAVQWRACEALSLLAEVADCAAHMRAGGRASVLLQQAMAAHPDDSAIQGSARQALLWVDKPEV